MSLPTRSSLWVLGCFLILHFAGVFCEDPVSESAGVSTTDCSSETIFIADEPNCSANKTLQCRNTCTKFIICGTVSHVVFDCPPSTKFNSKIGACDYHYMAKECTTVSDNEPTSPSVSEPEINPVSEEPIPEIMTSEEDELSNTVEPWVFKPKLTPFDPEPLTK